MLMRVLFIQAVFILGVYSAAIDRNKDSQNSDEFGESENFLKNQVRVPHIPDGSNGKVEEVSLENSVTAKKKEELDSLLREIYNNFITSTNSKNQDQHESPTTKATPLPPTTTTAATTAKPLDFKNLESAVDNLIKALSNEPNTKNKVMADYGSSEKYSSFHDYEPVDIDKNAKDNSKAIKKPISFEEFKSKFEKAFLDSAETQKLPFGGKKDDSAEQRLPFGGKKKNDVVKNSVNEDPLYAKSLSGLYDELKREVKIDKERLQKKVAVEVPAKIVALSDDENKAKIIEEKKKEILSLIDKLLKGQKSVFNGKKDEKSDTDAEFDKLYGKPVPDNIKPETQDKKSVTKVFLESFERGLQANDEHTKESVNEYISKQGDVKDSNDLKVVNNYIQAKRKETNENMEKERTTTETSKNVDDVSLRKNLVDLINVLDSSIKRESTNALKAPDAVKYEKELETIAKKKESEQSIDNMIDLLKGFDIDVHTGNTKSKQDNDRP